MSEPNCPPKSENILALEHLTREIAAGRTLKVSPEFRLAAERALRAQETDQDDIKTWAKKLTDSAFGGR